MLMKIIFLIILPVLFMFFNVGTQIIDEIDELLTETMSNITDDVICVSDIGNCITCINKNYGNVLYQKIVPDNKIYIGSDNHDNMLWVSYLNNDRYMGSWLHINISNGNLISKQEFML